MNIKAIYPSGESWPASLDKALSILKLGEEGDEVLCLELKGNGKLLFAPTWEGGLNELAMKLASDNHKVNCPLILGAAIHIGEEQ